MAQAPDFVAAEHRKIVYRNADPYRRYLIAVSIVIVGALLIGALLFAASMYNSAHENTANASVESNLVQVSSAIPGLLKEVLVQDNQTVKKNQIIARLDSRELNLRERQAVTAVEMARQQSQSARMAIAQIEDAAQMRSSQIAQKIAFAESALKAAPAEFAKLKKEEHVATGARTAALREFEAVNTRYEQLVALANQGMADQSMAQQARNLIEQARAKSKDANNNVKAVQAKAQRVKEIVAHAQSAMVLGREDNSSAKKQLAAAKQNLGISLTAVKQAELMLEQAQLFSHSATIVAPVDGIIAQKILVPGQRVQQGQPIVVIVEPGMWVVANFDEKQVGRIAPGQRVAIRVATSPKRIVVGRVKSVAPVAFAHAASGTKRSAPPQLQNVSHVQDPERAGQASIPKAMPLPPATSSETVKQAPPGATQGQVKELRTVPVKVEFDTQSLKAAGLTVLPGMSASVSIDLR